MEKGDYEPKPNDCIKDILQCGRISSLDATDYGYLYEVVLADRTNVSRSRVNILRAVKSILETYTHALVVFHYENTKDAEWRFTYMHKGASQKDSTQAKRYTYLCGKEHPSHTVAKNCIALKNSNFSDEAYLQAFSVEALTKEFFNQLFKWYDTWACKVVRFPSKNCIASHAELTAENNQLHLIRLITRIMFVWFIKQKDLIPAWIFDRGELETLLSDGDLCSEQKGNYYNAVLQNLFFGALNKKITERAFAEKSFDGVPNEQYGIKSLFRDDNSASFFTESHAQMKERFEGVPFLNGGLFECLDYDVPHGTDSHKVHYVDGFSRNADRRAFVPNALFWSEDEARLGLIPLFSRYNFTVEESTATDVQVALDPELLGKIFENLLGTYNPETKESARKESGSFYTPREIVSYMVNTSLAAYLQEKAHDVPKEAIEALVNGAVSVSLSAPQITSLRTALFAIKIIDPACGSGAFPMGILNKLVELHIALNALEETADENLYKLKTRIIEDSIFGVDIQPIAVQICKLRFFISLICEQPKMQSKEQNYGYSPLPNLETKFVAANTLIGKAKKTDDMALFADPKIDRLSKELLEIRKAHFSAKTAKEKKENREKDERLRTELSKLLEADNVYSPEDARQLARWNPYDQTAPASPFFDAEWMFGVKDGFDIVIGNPPYISAPMQVANPQLAKQREELIKRKTYRSLYQKWDLYIPFIEFGTQLNNEGGITAMIVPFPLTNQLYAKMLRKMLVEECDMFELVDLNGTKVFENATVSNCIPFIRKTTTTGKSSTVIEPVEMTDSEKVVSTSSTTKSTWISHINENLEIRRAFLQTHADLVQDERTLVWNVTQEKRETNRHAGMHVLGDYCYVSKGMVLNSDENSTEEKFKKADLISETKDKIHCRKFLEGKDCGKYVANRIRYLEYDTERVPEKLSRPTFRELYTTPKLMFNRLGELQVFFDENGDFTTSDAMFVCLKWDSLSNVENKSIASSIKKFSTMTRAEMEKLSQTVDLRYLLGIMNSRYASVLLTNLRGGDYHIYPEHIRNIPIPPATKAQQ